MNVPVTITMLSLLAAIPLAFGIGLRIGLQSATPREPNAEPGPPRIDGWRAERQALDESMEEMRDVLIEIRHNEIVGERVPPWHRRQAEWCLRRGGEKIRDLNMVIAESEGENQ